tara:strand:+ start:863 stop:1261 length:399 start_codon:yes stop_codon:yes gene_type:complete
MKTNEFKKILKPLIEQTVREVLFQEGVLSKVVAEVARGLNSPILENKQTKTKSIENEQDQEEYNKQKKERIKRLNESIGLKTNIFENVQTIPESNSNSPLSGVNPGDSGVDISAIQGLSKGKWKSLMGKNNV